MTRAASVIRMTRFVVQLHFDRENHLGPGKIELLGQIEKAGSLRGGPRHGHVLQARVATGWRDEPTSGASVVATRFGGSLLEAPR